ELAVQSSNATNSASDRVALQAEVTQLAAEIDRVAKQTNFNGQKILDGSFAGAVFQVGANSGDNVTLGALADTRSSQVSNISYGTSSLTGAAALNTDDLNPPALDDFADPIAKGDLKITVGAGLTIDLEAIEPANSSLERLGQVVTAINNKSADTGVTVYMSKVPNTNSYELHVMSEKLDAAGAPVAVTFGAGFTATLTGVTGGLDIDPADATEGMTNVRGIDDIDVRTQEGAWVALKKIDSAVDQVNGARATLGAMQSRFENAVSNIDIQVENLSAARGRIVDADFAKETANLSRTQILQQAGTAMVAQANQLPQQVLQLLQS
ncbi:flagellin, partial [Comamonas sp.]|uniref:flagellin n=1 Tax=Comamonas sp. TaxID=34028 RepID=UPI002FC6D54E